MQQEIKDNLKDTFGVMLLVAAGVGLYHTTVSVVELIYNSVRNAKAKRRYKKLLDILQDKVDNQGFAEELDEEHRQMLREMGIKF